MPGFRSLPDGLTLRDARCPTGVPMTASLRDYLRRRVGAEADVLNVPPSEGDSGGAPSSPNVRHAFCASQPRRRRHFHDETRTASQSNPANRRKIEAAIMNASGHARLRDVDEAHSMPPHLGALVVVSSRADRPVRTRFRSLPEIACPWLLKALAPPLGPAQRCFSHGRDGTSTLTSWVQYRRPVRTHVFAHCRYLA